MTHADTPPSHPRYVSLTIRDRIVDGLRRGITSEHGLLAHGRGEAFDYLVGERTNDFAERAIEVAAARLLTAKQPVISVNGNTAALVPEGLVQLSRAVPAPLEVNLFHRSAQREGMIREFLLDHGADTVLMPSPDHAIGVDSNRRFVNPEGILAADLVFVPLEDGDRCEELRSIGKDVITVDLNPSSRTAMAATVAIVDNIVRALPRLLQCIANWKTDKSPADLADVHGNYNNDFTLRAARRRIVAGFSELTNDG